MDYRKKNNEKLVPEYNDLKIKYDELKSSYDKHLSASGMAEEKLLKRTSIISAFNQYSIELEEQQSESISGFIVNSFKKLFEVRAVWISSYSEETHELIIESSTTTDSENSKVMRYLGLALHRYRTSLNDEKLELILSSRTKMFSSLNEISFGQIPQIIGKSIEKIFDVGWFLGVALIDRGKLYGTLVIAGYKKQEELQPDIVKIFSDLTSTVLRRKEAEHQLITSEEKFKKAFITSPDSININRLDDGMYVSVNSGFTKMTGFTEEEVIGKTSIELNIWVDLSAREKLVKALLENTEVQNVETAFRKKDGSILIGIMSASIIELDGVKHLLNITRDITFRIQAEEALRRSKAQYEDLVSKIPVAIYILRTFPDRSFVLDYASPRMADMLDLSIEKMIEDAKNLYDKIYPEDLESFIRLNEEGIMLCQPFDWSGRVINKERIKWLHISSSPEPQTNGDVLWHGIMTDITEQKLAETSLINSERLLRDTQKIARLGSFVWDLTSDLWKSSSILDEIFGINKKYNRTFEGWVNLIHPDFKKMMIDYVTNDILGKHHKFDKEYLIIRQADGQIRWVHGISELEFDKSKKPLKLIGTIIDITDRKNADDEIKKLNVSLEERVVERTAQLEAANSELQAFAYSVSHDLRAPLRAIDGFSKFVIEDYGNKLDSEGQRLLGLIRSNTHKMDKLITDILALSRVTRGDQKKSRIDMTKMAVSMFKEAASPDVLEKLDFIIDDLPETYADPTYIKQVWINLISNAIKFTSLKSDAVIKIGGYADNGYNVYYIRDNGAGFNPEYSHKLFGVFQRLHKANEFEGTGVGLAIVQRIIHKHGGKVWADGKEDRGATFYFSLPSSR
jgi:PAS domain S-box-containing protein